MSIEASIQPADVDPTVTFAYTQFHLSAVASPHSHNIRQCTCEEKERPALPEHQSKLIRVYYTEPSYYDYNRGSYLIKETRFDPLQKWHAPSDELVADDAAAGSPVAAIGWWQESKDGPDPGDPWETRVYYVSSEGKIREARYPHAIPLEVKTWKQRINHSYFDPTPREDFDAELPAPEKLATPCPGWKRTPRSAELPTADPGDHPFPDITPHPSSKLAAVRTERGEIYLFYQEYDTSIRVLVLEPAKGWIQQDPEALPPGKAMPGTSMSALSGGWDEVRLFYVTPQDVLAELYEGQRSNWRSGNLPPYKLAPKAMLTAVAWNYASRFFQIRVYASGGKHELQEYSFNRCTGGWRSIDQDNGADFDALLPSDYPPPAVAAVMVGDGCTTKIYFHPRRFIAEWDVCAKTTFPSPITSMGEKSISRREIEKETRRLVEEQRKRQEEEERKSREEEERKREEEEEEKKRQEEERNNGPALSASDLKEKEKLKSVKVGDTADISGAVLQKIMASSGCKQGYKWKKTQGGWRCAGGGHSLTDAQFEAL